VLTIYVYDPKDWRATLELVDTTSPYALTGCVWGQDKKATNEATEKLTHAAGNFYINDKPLALSLVSNHLGAAALLEPMTRLVPCLIWFDGFLSEPSKKHSIRLRIISILSWKKNRPHSRLYSSPCKNQS